MKRFASSSSVPETMETLAYDICSSSRIRLSYDDKRILYDDLKDLEAL